MSDSTPVSAVESRLDPLVADASGREAASHDKHPWRYIWFDLGLVSTLLVLATASTLLEAPAGLRIPLGILLVLVLPGYTMSAALFPSNDGPDGVARAALSVALSLATIPPLALAIDRSPWRIERTTVTIGLLIVTLVAVVVAGILRTRLPANERYLPRIDVGFLPPPSTWTRAYWIVAGAFALAGLLFVIGGYDVVKTRLIGAPLTEFALYNAAGEAQFYPRTIIVGEPAEVQVSIANHENRQVTYRLVIAGVGVAVDTLTELTLANGETWQRPVRFMVTSSGSDLPVRFELYRIDQPSDGAPYRLLQLIVEGQAAGSP